MEDGGRKIMARTIVVTSGKGGVGKSSVSVNLAVALAKKEAKVCLIDADFGLKNLDVMMGLENRVIYDLKDVVDGRCNLEQVLIKDKRVPTLYLIPACKSLKFNDFKVDYMQSVVDHFKHQFDYIIIDSPAGVEKGFEYACRSANEAIVVVNLDLSSIRDCDRVVGLLMKRGIMDISMVVNRLNMDYIGHQTTLSLKEATDILSLPLLGVIYEDESMIAGNNRGVPVFLNSESLLHDCFERMARRLNGENVAFVSPRRKTFLQKIFQK